MVFLNGYLLAVTIIILPSVISFTTCSIPRHLTSNSLHSSSTTLGMVRTRGLETSNEGATPKEGGMTLFVKAGPQGTELGDCPFAHFIRIVLHEKNLEYELRPCVQETKPNWLIEHYGGKMPALRHRKECYVESNVIADYLDFFFADPEMTNKKLSDDPDSIDNPTVGFFPAVAQYLKNTSDDEEENKLQRLREVLSNLNDHFDKIAKESEEGVDDLYLEGKSNTITMRDCSLGPQLYHLSVGIKEFKSNVPDIATDYPAVKKYMDIMFARKSFQETLYPPETVIWGWENARK